MFDQSTVGPVLSVFVVIVPVHSCLGRALLPVNCVCSGTVGGNEGVLQSCWHTCSAAFGLC